MSDTPREPEEEDSPTSRLLGGRSGYASTDEPVTGAPAGAAGTSAGAAGTPAGAAWDEKAWDDASRGAEGQIGSGRSDPAPSGAGDGDAGAGPSGTGTGPTGTGTGPSDTGTGPSDAGTGQGGAGGGRSGSGGAGRAARRGMWGFGPVSDGDERQRRRRRWFVGGISVAAAIIVVALCAGALSVISAVDDVRDSAADARESRRLRDADCLELERRLNRLIPPGATTGPKERATAVRNENAAVRIYVSELHSQLEEDGWRQLLDARTVYADALDRQASARTPAFYVAPRTTDGDAVAAELEGWSPAPCAGPIRRLAAPEL